MMPRVSVVMAAYNGERHLQRAVESILGQDFDDFEFIVVDDGSVDGTYGIMSDYARRDGRLIAVQNDTNIGLTASLNKGLAMSQGEYFARQDADDISLSDRLARQVAFLDAHPEVCVVGTATGLLDDAGQFLGRTQALGQPNDLNKEILQRNFLAHGSIMARRQAIIQAGAYREAFRYAQDYDLWLRMSEFCHLGWLGDVLYWRRATPNGISANRSIQQARFRSLARLAAAERRECGSERTPVEIVAADIAAQEPSGALERSLGYLGYARALFSVGRAWSGVRYFVLSVVAYPANSAPWRWLIGAVGRRIKVRF